MFAEVREAAGQVGTASPHRDLIDQYLAVIDLMASRYGPAANSVTVASFEFLSALHEAALSGSASDRDRAELQPLIDAGARLMVRRYERMVPPGSLLPREIRGADPELYVFQRAYYDEHYAATGAAVAEDVVEIAADGWSVVSPGRVYLYVLDESGRLIVYRQPMRLEDALLQTNPLINGREVCHPMLVPKRLTARSAGEIILFGDDRVRGTIVNLKSGHFRPTAKSLPVLRSALESVFPQLRVVTLLPVQIEVEPAPALQEASA